MPGAAAHTIADPGQVGTLLAPVQPVSTNTPGLCPLGHFPATLPQPGLARAKRRRRHSLTAGSLQPRADGAGPPRAEGSARPGEGQAASPPARRRHRPPQPGLSSGGAARPHSAARRDGGGGGAWPRWQLPLPALPAHLDGGHHLRHDRPRRKERRGAGREGDRSEAAGCVEQVPCTVPVSAETPLPKINGGEKGKQRSCFGQAGRRLDRAIQEGSVREKPLGLRREARPWRWRRVPGPLTASQGAAPSEGLRGRCPGKGAAAFPELGVEALSISTARSGTAVGHVRP